jgi:hypothetical protein
MVEILLLLGSCEWRVNRIMRLNAMTPPGWGGNTA